MLYIIYCYASGKHAPLGRWLQLRGWSMQVRADIAASFQRVALAHLEERVKRAAAWAVESQPDIHHLVVAGGVAANQLLRGRLQACPISPYLG